MIKPIFAYAQLHGVQNGISNQAQCDKKHGMLREYRSIDYNAYDIETYKLKSTGKHVYLTEYQKDTL